MDKKIKIIFSAALFFGFLGSAKDSLAANWYVDNAASGVNNGTSWSNAWTGFSQIIWGSIQPGDTIFISGGNSEKIYNERIVIGASGTEGNMISIRVGQDAGHNGKVVLDMEKVQNRYSPITVSGRKYFSVSGRVGAGNERKMELKNSWYSGVGVTGLSDHFILEYLDIHDNGMGDPNSGIEAQFSANPEDAEIRYCNIYDNFQDGLHLTGPAAEPVSYDVMKIHHNTITNVHDDGIEAGLGGISFYNNEIGVRILPERGHPDILQLYNGYLKIYNNYIHDWYRPESLGDGALMGVYIEADGGDQSDRTSAHDVQVYNNLFVESASYVPGSVRSNGLTLAYSDPDWTDVYNVSAFNNTFVGNVGSPISLALTGTGATHQTVHDFSITNNLFYYTLFPGLDRGDNIDITYGGFGSGADVVVDYNSVYGVDLDEVHYGPPPWPSYAEFVEETGCQSHGLTIDPLLNDPANYVGNDGVPFTDDDGLRPRSNSPVCSAGTGGSVVGALSCSGSSDVTAPAVPAGLNVS